MKTLYIIFALVITLSINANAFRLNEADGKDMSFRILDNQQYLQTHITDTQMGDYVVRSLSIEVEAGETPFVVDFMRLFNGKMRCGDALMYQPEADYEYSCQIKKLSGGTVVPRFPIPFFKKLGPNEKFTINLVYPDMLDTDTVLSMINIEMVKENEGDKKDSYTIGEISGNSVNLSFGQHLISRAIEVYEQSKPESKGNFNEIPVIPDNLLDSNTQKRHYVTKLEYYQIQADVLNNYFKKRGYE